MVRKQVSSQGWLLKACLRMQSFKTKFKEQKLKYDTMPSSFNKSRTLSSIDTIFVFDDRFAFRKFASWRRSWIFGFPRARPRSVLSAIAPRSGQQKDGTLLDRKCYGRNRYALNFIDLWQQCWCKIGENFCAQIDLLKIINVYITRMLTSDNFYNSALTFITCYKTSKVITAYNVGYKCY